MMHDQKNKLYVCIYIPQTGTKRQIFYAVLILFLNLSGME